MFLGVRCVCACAYIEASRSTMYVFIKDKCTCMYAVIRKKKLKTEFSDIPRE